MNKIFLGLLVAILVLQGASLYKSSKPAGLSSFGAAAEVTSNWTAGSFSSDLSVGGDLVVTGTSTLSGIVSGVPKEQVITMSSTATTTACTVLNNTSVTRTVIDAGVVDRGTAASTGSITWTAGTTTFAGAIATKMINTTVTRASGVDVITTTTTSPARTQWRPNEYFSFISSSTTNAGTCNLLYVQG